LEIQDGGDFEINIFLIKAGFDTDISLFCLSDIEVVMRNTFGNLTKIRFHFDRGFFLYNM
jgi:hypothetical protein